MAKFFATLVVIASGQSACSADDRSKLQAMDDDIILGVDQQTRVCALVSWAGSGSYVDHSGFMECMEKHRNISSDCAGCFYGTAFWDYGQCEEVCRTNAGWCAEDCLTCTAPAHEVLSKCTGIPIQAPKPCLSLPEVAASLGCSVFAGAMEGRYVGGGTYFAPTDRALEAYLGPNPWDCFNRTRDNLFWGELVDKSNYMDGIVQLSDMYDGMLLREVPDQYPVYIKLSQNGTSFAVSEYKPAQHVNGTFFASIVAADNFGNGGVVHVIDDLYWGHSYRPCDAGQFSV